MFECARERARAGINECVRKKKVCISIQSDDALYLLLLLLCCGGVSDDFVRLLPIFTWDFLPCVFGTAFWNWWLVALMLYHVTDLSFSILLLLLDEFVHWAIGMNLQRDDGPSTVLHAHHASSRKLKLFTWKLSLYVRAMESVNYVMIYWENHRGPCQVTFTMLIIFQILRWCGRATSDERIRRHVPFIPPEIRTGIFLFCSSLLFTDEFNEKKNTRKDLLKIDRPILIACWGRSRKSFHHSTPSFSKRY